MSNDTNGNGDSGTRQAGSDSGSTPAPGRVRQWMTLPSFRILRPFLLLSVSLLVIVGSLLAFLLPGLVSHASQYAALQNDIAQKERSWRQVNGAFRAALDPGLLAELGKSWREKEADRDGNGDGATGTDTPELKKAVTAAVESAATQIRSGNAQEPSAQDKKAIEHLLQDRYVSMSSSREAYFQAVQGYSDSMDFVLKKVALLRDAAGQAIAAFWRAVILLIIVLGIALLLPPLLPIFTAARIDPVEDRVSQSDGNDLPGRLKRVKEGVDTLIVIIGRDTDPNSSKQLETDKEFQETVKSIAKCLVLLPQNDQSPLRPDVIRQFYTACAPFSPIAKSRARDLTRIARWEITQDSIRHLENVLQNLRNVLEINLSETSGKLESSVPPLPRADAAVLSERDARYISATLERIRQRLDSAAALSESASAKLAAELERGILEWLTIETGTRYRTLQEAVEQAAGRNPPALLAAGLKYDALREALADINSSARVVSPHNPVGVPPKPRTDGDPAVTTVVKRVDSFDDSAAAAFNRIQQTLDRQDKALAAFVRTFSVLLEALVRLSEQYREIHNQTSGMDTELESLRASKKDLTTRIAIIEGEAATAKTERDELKRWKPGDSLAALRRWLEQPIPEPTRTQAERLLLVAGHLDDGTNDWLADNLREMDLAVYQPPFPPARALAEATATPPPGGTSLSSDALTELTLCLVRAQAELHERLQRKEVTPIAPRPGDDFIPRRHEETEQDVVSVDDPAQHGKVNNTLRIGFEIDGKVRRKAVVRRRVSRSVIASKAVAPGRVEMASPPFVAPPSSEATGGEGPVAAMREVKTADEANAAPPTPTDTAPRPVAEPIRGVERASGQPPAEEGPAATNEPQQIWAGAVRESGEGTAVTEGRPEREANPSPAVSESAALGASGAAAAVTAVPDSVESATPGESEAAQETGAMAPDGAAPGPVGNQEEEVEEGGDVAPLRSAQTDGPSPVEGEEGRLSGSAPRPDSGEVGVTPLGDGEQVSEEGEAVERPFAAPEETPAEPSGTRVWDERRIG